jgi:hypothetical protein
MIASDSVTVFASKRQRKTLWFIYYSRKHSKLWYTVDDECGKTDHLFALNRFMANGYQCYSLIVYRLCVNYCRSVA